MWNGWNLRQNKKIGNLNQIKERWVEWENKTIKYGT